MQCETPLELGNRVHFRRELEHQFSVSCYRFAGLVAESKEQREPSVLSNDGWLDGAIVDPPHLVHVFRCPDDRSITVYGRTVLLGRPAILTEPRIIVDLLATSFAEHDLPLLSVYCLGVSAVTFDISPAAKLELRTTGPRVTTRHLLWRVVRHQSLWPTPENVILHTPTRRVGRPALAPREAPLCLQNLESSSISVPQTLQTLFPPNAHEVRQVGQPHYYGSN